MYLSFIILFSDIDLSNLVHLNLNGCYQLSDVIFHSFTGYLVLCYLFTYTIDLEIFTVKMFHCYFLSTKIDFQHNILNFPNFFFIEIFYSENFLNYS